MASRWRKFFDGAGADIWTVIDYALDVAAEDFPHELRLRRDGFVEKMFAHRSVLAEACLPVVGHHAEEENEDDKIVEAPEYDLDQDHVRVTNDLSDEEDRRVISADLYDDAEALTDAMEAESRQMQEVYSIKEIIADVSEEEDEILTALQRLEEMHVSVETLKATEIGKEVNALRKHESRRVRSLAKALVRGWKDLVDEWVKSAGDVAAAAMAGSGSSRDMDHDGDGLPSPPLDPGGLLASTRTASIEMSHFFDDLDDLSAGSGPSPPSSNGVSDEVVNPSLNKRQQQSRGPRANSPDSRAPKSKGRVVTSNGHVESRMGDGRQIQSNGRKATDIANGNDRLANGNSRVNSGPGRPVDRTVPPKTNGNGPVRKFETKPPVIKANKPKAENGKLQESQDISVAARLEAAKRRLHERYEQVETAKRQRVVQVMDLTDLPKGGPARAKLTQAASKPGGLNRPRPQMRR